MKRNFIGASMMSLVLAAACFMGGCAEKLHKPTTVGNAGTTALVAYFAANQAATKYIALPRCAAPPVQPCSVQSVVDKIATADTAAYNAAMAADAAAATQNDKEKASQKLTELKEATP